MSLNPNSKWFVKFGEPRQNAKCRLFCFPYAGGGASIFRSWQKKFSNVEVIVLQLPGRESRVNELPFREMQSIIDIVAPSILPYLDRPYYFFGHSMGSLIAHSLVDWLEQNNQPLPIKTFLSGSSPVPNPARNYSVYKLDEVEFIEELEKMGGTPIEILADRELMSMFLPLLRADFEIAETAKCAERQKINSPIVAFGGIDDDTVPVDLLLKWREYSSQRFNAHLLPGGHFFLQSAADSLLALLDLEIKSGAELFPSLS